MKAALIAAAGFIATLSPASVVRADDAADMAKVVTGFYEAYSTFHPSDGIPDAKGLQKYEPYISPALDRLLKDGDAAETDFAKANKDSPPMIEGDLFTSNFEGATRFTLGTCKREGESGHCGVGLTYVDSASDPRGKPFSWTDTVYLVLTSQGWRVDDIGYGGTWPFGNKGRLSDTVKQAIADARG
jgi:hypothetical protein